MKNILKFLILTINVFCLAQNPIINIKDQNGSVTDGAYYKDVDNLLDPFEGEYNYSNGGTSLKIILQKRPYAGNGKYYEDLMIGEYEYKENNITKVTTLDKLNENYAWKWEHGIVGNSILKSTSKPPCPDCSMNEKRLRLSISQGSAYGVLVVRKIVHNGQEAIKIHIRQTSNNITTSRDSPAQINGLVSTPSYLSIPSGYYILIKQ